MNKDKPPVPDTYIHAYSWPDIYFGDDAAQQDAIDNISNNIAKGKGGIYVIFGPPRTGKNTVFEEVSRLVIQENPDKKISDYSHYYWDKDKRDYSQDGVIRLREDVEIKSLSKVLEEAEEIRRVNPNIAIIIDALDWTSIFHKKEAGVITRAQQDLGNVLQKHPDVIVVHTKHDLSQVRQALWDLNVDLQSKFSGTGDQINESIMGLPQSKLGGQLIAALNNGDRQEYDAAFDKITTDGIRLLLCYDSVFLPAIDRTVAGTQALCAFLRKDCKLKNIEEIRDKANDAAIAAHEAKTIFDREFRGKEIPDPAQPNQKVLAIETPQQIKAVALLSRHLQQAYTLVRELRDAVYEREYSEDPELRPKILQLETPEDIERATDELAESLSRSSKERREDSVRREAMYEAQSEMPEHQIIKTIDDAKFVGILADADGLLRGFNEALAKSQKRNGNQK